MHMKRDRLVVFEGKPGKDGQRRFYWKLVGGNGEQSARSQAYTRRFDAKRLGVRRFPKALIEHEYPTGARVRGA
jgi:uncharacterized protein YegP (UPF0339 family)